jgi:hypothetical protein
MNVPRKHHYIPVFYLKQWRGTDGQLCEYRHGANDRIMTRRTFPNGTGYLKDLYRVDGLPDAIAQEVEQKFMAPVDTKANLALRKLVRNDTAPWDSEMRSAWTRFILSLRFRNPEAVSIIKSQMVAVWNALLENARRNYETVRYDGDPATFEEFMARTDSIMPMKAAMRLLTEIIDNPRTGTTISDMKWSRVSLTASTISLLTSDRPLDMPHGLGASEAYIALPIGPRMLFVADYNGTSVRQLGALDPTSIVKSVNTAVVHQARQFVWGLDDGQLRFVKNRMSRAPDRVLISDAQRQAAIDAALTTKPSTESEREAFFQQEARGASGGTP